MEIRMVELDDPATAVLLESLGTEYQARYGAGDEMNRTTPEDFRPPTGAFVVIVDRGETVAGGGFRPHSPGVCEIKRMWTHPGYRRRGLAQRVLTALEEEATAAGYGRLVLETGPLQPEAEALYLARGYERIPPFGPYERALAFTAALPGGDQKAKRISDANPATRQ